MNINYKEKLLEIYNNAISTIDIENEITEQDKNYILEIGSKCKSQKGVYTVLVTLLIYKILNPQQDIRYHQSNMPSGFSGRGIDTQYITPTLKQLGLPAMAESGWLTRSLEQPYPYTLNYEGKINDKNVKKAFLSIIDYVQNNPEKAEICLRLLMNKVIEVAKANQINIVKLSNPDKIDIKTLINCLDQHFNFDYETRGGSKLPVIAFYAIYSCLVTEIERYKSCTLKILASHTASDRTSQSAGDIELFDEAGNLFEAIEIKHGKEIDLQIIHIAKEKIIKYNPQRYFIFASKDIKESESNLIEIEIKKTAEAHGCQIILNGIIPTLKYYLRLIMSLEKFIDEYSKLIELDQEIQTIHKTKWNEILSRFN
ncbi:hypothetical protein [Planktothrix paucivesiculata]|uniref:Cytosine-specific methyltransferase n=1 Tax=Planktothrix paucivesiculata PCC 9631 TaxID=671071 RepID=A0A7Z9BW43_9CYAN